MTWPALGRTSGDRASAAVSRRRLDLHVAAAISAAAYLGLAVTASRPGFRLATFFTAMGAATAAWLFACVRSQRHMPTVGVVLAWAVVFRLIGLCGPALLEDDQFRYLWDGHVFATRGSPYGPPPMAWFDDATLPDEWARVLDNINHPDVPTIYGPVAQLLFLASHAIAPAQLWPLKTMLVGLDLVVVVLLVRLSSARAALVYAWAPLAIKEVAFSAHLEPLAIAPVLLALWASERGGSVGGAALAGLATAARLQAGLVAPLLWARIAGREAAVFSLMLATCYLPALLSGAAERGGLSAFAQAWEFNSTGFAVLQVLLGDAARPVSGLILAVVLAASLQRSRRVGARESSVPLLGAAFLVSPVVNPWYLLWLLAFAAMAPRVWALAAVAIVPLAYAHGLHLGEGLAPYEHPWWVRPAQVLVVVSSALAGWWWTHRHEPTRGPNATE